MQELHWLDPDNSEFPDPGLALESPNGLLAIGGDLSAGRLLNAYRQGIFPWYEAGQPVLWWTPDPRMVLFPEELHISRSLKKTLRHHPFRISTDHAFADVIKGCADQRGKNREGTWITGEMQEAYIRLHQLGWAHSVEVWHQDKLVGGLYGIAMGRVFFGESMFSNTANASKIAFVSLVTNLQQQGYRIIDCQIASRHLSGFGAREVSREEFMRALASALTPQSHWENFR